MQIDITVPPTQPQSSESFKIQLNLHLQALVPTIVHLLLCVALLACLKNCEKSQAVLQFQEGRFDIL